ncbi:MAG: transcription antitermination factor NusB [Lachnospiraceae bacterium]|nr:transcription antitermination factor NusB [Lachnospiraceae bacterium]
MGRRERREMVFLLLFGVEYHAPEEFSEQAEFLFSAEEEEYIEEECLKAAEEDRDVGDLELPSFLFEGREAIEEKALRIAELSPDLDRMLDERMQGWDLSRIGKVELTILRLALYEMLYDDEVSDAVAINEAVELAKKYGQEKSGEFVNGVLAKFAK